MARHNRMHVLNTAIEIGMVPLFYHADYETSLGLASACGRGGALVIEYTNRGPGALEVFAKMEKYFAEYMPEVILGAGSVIDAPTAALFIAQGANFIVSPNMDEETAYLCNKHKIPYMPGCMTVTEIQNAERLGVEICKVFPGSAAGGPGFIKGVKAPRPWTSLMPTGGVTPERENLEKWFDAGVTCVGMGSQLVTKKIMDEKRFDELEAKVREAVALVKDIRR